MSRPGRAGPDIPTNDSRHLDYDSGLIRYLGKSDELKIVKYDCNVAAKSRVWAGAMLDKELVRPRRLTTTAPCTLAISSPKSDQMV